ncbi:UNVERIFIED_ORG: hypothetical protein CLV66_105242 [Actinomadura viridilutea]
MSPVPGVPLWPGELLVPGELLCLAAVAGAARQLR